MYDILQLINTSTVRGPAAVKVHNFSSIPFYQIDVQKDNISLLQIPVLSCKAGSYETNMWKQFFSSFVFSAVLSFACRSKADMKFKTFMFRQPVSDRQTFISFVMLELHTQFPFVFKTN